MCNIISICLGTSPAPAVDAARTTLRLTTPFLRAALTALIVSLASPFVFARSPGFVLESAGQLTSNPAHVLSGQRSILGSHSGGGSYTAFLRTDSSSIPLAA